MTNNTMQVHDLKKHWETIYQTKELKNVSWYQPHPATSLDFILQFNLPRHAKIIDIGGGDSLLVDHLLALGYADLTVLDISASALERAKMRLGEKAAKVKWIVSNILDFEPTEKYDLWHDRATFHFLTEDKQITKYVSIAEHAVGDEGQMIIGTFSEIGPKKCSGLNTKQYSEAEMTAIFDKFFTKFKCISEDHNTPFNATQNFLFCGFMKRKTQIAGQPR